MLDQVGAYEEEMIEMLKSISEMTDAMQGYDLHNIRAMMDVSQ